METHFSVMVQGLGFKGEEDVVSILIRSYQLLLATPITDIATSIISRMNLLTKPR